MRFILYQKCKCTKIAFFDCKIEIALGKPTIGKLTKEFMSPVSLVFHTIVTRDRSQR